MRVDHQKAMKLIAWALEGYANSKIPEFKTMNEKEFAYGYRIGNIPRNIKAMFFKVKIIGGGPTL